MLYALTESSLISSQPLSISPCFFLPLPISLTPSGLLFVSLNCHQSVNVERISGFGGETLSVFKLEKILMN